MTGCILSCFTAWSGRVVVLQCRLAGGSAGVSLHWPVNYSSTLQLAVLQVDTSQSGLTVFFHTFRLSTSQSDN